MIIGSALLAGALYLSTDAFGRRWRSFVTQELAARGLHLEFQRLVVNPFGRIVARNVRFFSDSSRSVELMRMSQLNMDFDPGRLIEGKFNLESLELSHAKVSLPQAMPPELSALADTPDSALELDDLSAKAVIADGKLDLRHAEGRLFGIQIQLRGELQLPAPDARPASEKSPIPVSQAVQQRVDSLQNHHTRIRRGLEWLKRFQFQTPPQLQLEFQGTVNRPLEMVAHLYLEAEGLSYGTYRCEALRAEADYKAGLLDLTRFQMKDRLGSVIANATWQMGAEDLKFHLTSSADLPSLAQAFLDNDNLREVVFYEPPNLALSGTWHVNGPLSSHKRPLRAIGQLDCGRFGSRGELFDGLKANIGIAPEGVYVRDLILRHKTGTLAAQTLLHEKSGARYQITARMDPHAFLPFARTPQTRELIQRFEFTPESSIDVEISGHGPELNFKLCENTGRGDLRRFKYRGLYLDSLQADLYFHFPIQKYQQVRAKRPEGQATAEEVVIHDIEKWVKLHGILSTIDPVGIVGVFNTKTADVIARYRLPNDTAASVEGQIFFREHEKDDFLVNFHHNTGFGHYHLLGRNHQIYSPKGLLRFQGLQLSYDVSGKVDGSLLKVKGTSYLKPDSGQFQVLVNLDTYKQEVFGKEMPFRDVEAKVSRQNLDQGIQFHIDSTLLGGHVTLNGVQGGPGKAEAYSGDLNWRNISLPRMAALYSKTNQSEGDLTGDFKFTGRGNDWSVLQGRGSLSILNGDLYSIPIVGVLAPLLGTILPKQIAGYNIAKEADCTFEVAQGQLMTDNFEALTSAFKILLKGSIDFLRDKLDLDAQIRVRGLPGLVLRPFSELLEYKGTGSVSNPHWEAKLLRGVSVNQRPTQARPVPEMAPEEPGKPNLLEEATNLTKPLLPQLKKIFNPLFQRNSKSAEKTAPAAGQNQPNTVSPPPP